MSVPPNTIDFMLACYTSAATDAVLKSQWHCEAGRHTREWLHANGLIDEDNRATERGKAWVKYICRAPIPSGPCDYCHKYYVGKIRRGKRRDPNSFCRKKCRSDFHNRGLSKAAGRTGVRPNRAA